MRYRAVAVALLALVFLVPMGTSQFSGQSDDGVLYRFGFSDTVTERNTVTECLEYDNRTDECTDSTTKEVMGQNRYVFDWDNVDVSRTDNGNIQVSAVMKPNEITKIIKKEQTPAITEQEAIDQLNQDYMWNGGDFDREAYSELVETAKGPVVSVVEGGAAVQTNTAESVMSNSGRVKFTVVTDDEGQKVTVKVGQNSGTIILNDDTDFRPPNSPNDDASLDGVTPDRKGDSQYKSGSLEDTLGIGYGSAAYWDGICTGGTSICNTQPYAQYRYDDDAGFSNVQDWSGNSNQMTIVGDPQATGGVFDTKAFDFDGSGDYLEANHGGSLDFTSTDYTLSTWINPDTVSSANMGVITEGGDGNQNNIDWRIRIFNGDIEFYDSQVTVSDSISSNVWTHVAVTYDAADDNVTLYKNGEVVGTATSTGAADAGTDNWYIGTSAYDDSRQFDGQIDETIIYDGFAASSTDVESDLWMYDGGFVGGSTYSSVYTSEWLNDSNTDDKEWVEADVSHALATSESMEIDFWTTDITNAVTATFDGTAGIETDTIDLSPLSNNESIKFDVKMSNGGDARFSPLVSSIDLDWQDPVSVATVNLTNPADNEVLETPQNIDETVNYEYEVNRSTPNSTDVELIRGGNVIDTDTQTTDFETYTYSEDLGPGTYSWKVNVTDNGDGTEISSNTRTFEIQEKVAVNVIPQTPSAGDTFTENQQVNASTDIENFRPDTVTVEQYFEDQDTGNTVTLPTSTVSSNTNKTVYQTDQLNPGNYTAVTEVYDSSGNLLNSDSTGTFEVTPVPVKLQLNNPPSLKDYYIKPGETVNPSFSVDVTANESGTAAVKLGEAPDPDVDPGATLHNLGSHSGNGSTITYVNDSVTVSEGSYAWYAGYDNDSDATFEYESSTSLFEVIEEQSPTITWVNPVDGDTIDALQNTTNVSFEFDVDTNFDADINVTLNDTSQNYGSVYNDSHVNGSETYTFTKELAPANYTATVNVTSSNTNNSYTELISFEVVDANPNQLDELLIWVADQTGVPLDTIQLIFAALVIIAVTSWVTIQTGSVSIGLVTSIITMGVVVSLGYLPVVYLIIAGLLALVLFLETETFG